MNRYDIHAVAIYRDIEIVGHVSSSKNVSISICRNHMSQKSTGSMVMVWKSHVSTIYYGPDVYVDKRRRWLSLYLLMDIISDFAQ